MTMQGKVCLITGGTNAIGKSTALELAQMGATVVIVGRNAQKTSRVVEEIRGSRSAVARKLRAFFAVRFGMRVATTQEYLLTRGES